MAEGDFDDLLKRLPAIAKAVNAFTSEAVQRQAFEALVDALRGGTPGPGRDSGVDGAAGGGRRRRKRKSHADTVSTEAKGSQRQARRVSPSFDKNLNLRPKSGKSFKDFATSKGPKTTFERNVVAVHWLKSAGVKTIGQDQVYTCYKDASWRLPANLYSNLVLTAHKKGWLDTADMNNVAVTPQGENLVDQDLPRTKKE